MQVQLKKTACAVTLALSLGAAQAGAINGIWFFGDSLTDGGAYSGIGGLPTGSRWTTDNAPNHADVLAAALGLKSAATNTGYNPSGNNYAQGGAQSSETNNTGPFSPISDEERAKQYNVSLQDLPDQVKAYTDTLKSKPANPNALYFVWSGGNDIPVAAAIGAAQGSAAAQASIAGSATSLARQLGTLKAAGAKLMMAPNLPAFGNTPAALLAVLQTATGYRSDIPESQQDAQVVGFYKQLEAAAKQGLSASATPNAAAQKAVTDAVLAQLAPALAKAGIAKKVTEDVTKEITKQVTAAMPAGTPEDVIKAQIAATLKASLATQVNTLLPGAITANLPAATQTAQQQLTEGYATAQTQLNQLTQLFNMSVDTGIAASGANVIRPDVAGLFAAALANPKAFGVDNVTGSQCANSSLTCSSNPKARDAAPALTYLFADDRHPSPLTHQVIGDYFATIVQAPALADALGQVPLSARRTVRETLSAHARALDAAPRAVGTVGALASAGFGRDNIAEGEIKPEAIATLGFDYQATPELALGVAFSGGKVKSDIGAIGSYDGDYRSLSALANLRRGPLWLDGDVFLGNTDIDTKRNIKLGPVYQATQTGSTRAIQMGLAVEGGYRMQLGAVNTGPQAGLRYEHIKVGALIEDKLDFSAMRFGEQKIKSLVGSIGWGISAPLGRATPYASVSYNHEFKGDARDIEAGLLTTSGNFVTQSLALAKNWTDLSAGVSVALAKDLTAFVQANGTAGRDDGNSWGGNIGLNMNF
ncbi:autotransporter domain-containing protein [Craterilacuibacter sp. RT1T]|uniref:autotransporter domain-containing protein n=1 Tax=Craterilacuibacter sp. RT1T TaxID=2942211 RepID=UPI0020C08349|nr:autotransporter domain-containing protein [Craterilacuibacter sp. RT1T]MCL6263715.1 autotransporter domain-containing protein [Craterilacuibacter sp. RT1T]